MKTINLVKTFDTERIFLSYGGVYSFIGISSINKYFHVFRGTILTALTSLVVFLYVVNLYETLSDLISFTEVLVMSMAISAFLFKLVNFILQENRMWTVEKLLENPLLTDMDEEEEAMFTETIKYVRLCATIFRILCVLVVVTYSVKSMFDISTEGKRELPYLIWLPFELDKSFLYIWFICVVHLAVAAWTNSNIDILTITLMTLATAEYEILKGRIRNIVPKENEEIDEVCIKGRIRTCIVHYNSINRLVSEFENTFSRGIFAQFVFYVLVLCATGFGMVVIPIKSMQFVMLVCYFNCVLFQMLLYCWFGHILMESSEEITYACYSADWFQCSASVQKLFIIIMERAKSPVKMRAAGYFAITLPTLMGIVKTSYSYFTVLRHMYNEKFDL